MVKVLRSGVAFSLLLFLSCAYLRVEKLKFEKIAFVKYGKGCGFIGGNQKEIPTNFFFANDYFYISDNINGRVTKFDYSGKPKLCISSSIYKPKEEKKKKENILDSILKPVESYFNFGNLGRVDAYYDNMIIVENKVPIKGKIAEKFKNLDKLSDDEVVSVLNSIKKLNIPSFLVVFDEDGKLRYTLENSFSSLKYFWGFKNDRIVVVTSKKEYVKISIFDKDKLVKSYDIFEGTDNRDLGLNLKEGDFLGYIDTILPDREHNVLYISVAFYRDIEFGYRKLFRFSLDSGKVDSYIMTLDDVDRFFYAFIKGKFYIWKTEEQNSIRLYIYNNFGSFEKSKRITFSDEYGDYFPKVFYNSNGDFYTVKYNKSGIEIYLWR